MKNSASLPLIFLLSTLLALPAAAQDELAPAKPARVRRLPRTVPLPTTPPPPRRWLLDGSIGPEVIVREGSTARFREQGFVQATLAGWHLWRLDRAGRLWLGGGPRLIRSWDKVGYYEPRPPQPNPLELAIENSQLTALNVALHAQVRLTHWLRLGGNIDLGGYTWGPSRLMHYIPSPHPWGYIPPRNVRPQRGNLLLGGKADRGTLTSEAYLGLGLTSQTSFRIGIHHTATSYVSEGARFQRFVTLPTAGFSYDLTR